jgi:hypothetical protein
MLPTAPVWAQTDTSALNGRITDATGGAIPGAQVVLTNESTHAERKVVSGDSGSYIFTLIQPGRYDVEAVAPGFKTFHDTGLQIDVAAPAAEFGILGRNTLVGPGLFNIDSTLSKRSSMRRTSA